MTSYKHSLEYLKKFCCDNGFFLWMETRSRNKHWFRIAIISDDGVNIIIYPHLTMAGNETLIIKEASKNEDKSRLILNKLLEYKEWIKPKYI